jgi:hypothetical protein
MRGLARRFAVVGLAFRTADGDCDEAPVAIPVSNPVVTSNSTDVALCQVHGMARRITIT